MKRILWLIACLLLLLPAACGAASPAENESVGEMESSLDVPERETETETEPDESEAVEETDENAEVEVEVETEVEAEAETEEAVPELPAAEEEIGDFTPAHTPEEAYVLRDNDYFKGAEEPDVVLIEYGDFQ